LGGHSGEAFVLAAAQTRKTERQMPAKLLSHRIFRRAVSAVAVCALLAAPAFAGSPQALTRSDAALYQAAFTAVRNGDFKTAEKRLKGADDRSLVGYVELEKLMHPSAHTASYGELTAWLDKYGDLPGAERVYTLAQKRQPAGTDLSAPAVLTLIRDVAERGLALVGLPNPAARTAFYNGDVDTAFKLAAQSSERWIAGLSAFRLGRFADARTYFDAVAMDGSQDEWLRSGAAFWAARAAIADGTPELAPAYLNAAAQMPWTFYGMLAEAQLGLEPSARFDAPMPMQAIRPVAEAMTSMLIKVSTAPQPLLAAPEPFAANASFDEEGAERLVQSDPRARRAAALMQLGRMNEAAREIELGLAECNSAQAQQSWAALGKQLAIPAEAVRAPSMRGFDPADYPTPVLNPAGGFTLDPALVYAIVRQESRFNAGAVSRAGAVGLMQVMPATAVLTTGDRNSPRALRDPSSNLRIGQDYFVWLLQHGVGDDLLAAVAAYNGGPGSPLNTQARMGSNADSLMMIESLPAQETRNYVERVMANYWLYRRQFGAETASLKALAGGTKISAGLEHAVTPPMLAPPPAPLQAAADVTLASGPLEGHD
jgi:soluble lytic murein transglycosylase-like protein